VEAISLIRGISKIIHYGGENFIFGTAVKEFRNWWEMNTDSVSEM
jgi:hypothetical protein